LKFIKPEPLSQTELVNIFKEFYYDKKIKNNLGSPSFANFKIYLKILSREFLLLHYNVIFLDKNYQTIRFNFFDVINKLALINSKPAIHALIDQEKAMKTSQTMEM
jgi:hypothetical protein